MIRAVYRDGLIQPLGGVPADWQEGDELTILQKDEFLGADDPIPDIDTRLAELHELGPMEFEPGEREEMERIWKEMDEFGRLETKRMWNQQP
jgi:hypothetical protein